MEKKYSPSIAFARDEMKRHFVAIDLF